MNHRKSLQVQGSAPPLTTNRPRNIFFWESALRFYIFIPDFRGLGYFSVGCFPHLASPQVFTISFRQTRCSYHLDVLFTILRGPWPLKHRCLSFGRFPPLTNPSHWPNLHLHLDPLHPQLIYPLPVSGSLPGCYILLHHSLIPSHSILLSFLPLPPLSMR